MKTTRGTALIMFGILSLIENVDRFLVANQSMLIAKQYNVKGIDIAKNITYMGPRRRNQTDIIHNRNSNRFHLFLAHKFTVLKITSGGA